MSRDFFNKAAENTIELEKQIMPEPYKYYKFIRTPKEMGMSTKGGMKDLQDNVAALVSYGELLISGKGAATDVETPLGNKYFLKTGGQCAAGGKKDGIVDRYVYIDNVPKGNIPMSEDSFIKYQEFKGIIPGMMQDIEDINTTKMFRGFMEEEHPACRSLTLETINGDNKKSNVTQYIADSDIREMNPCSFPDNKNPITGVTCPVPISRPELPDQILERTTYGGHIPGDDEAKAAAATHPHEEHHPGGVGDQSGAGAITSPEEIAGKFQKSGATGMDAAIAKASAAMKGPAGMKSTLMGMGKSFLGGKSGDMKSKLMGAVLGGGGGGMKSKLMGAALGGGGGGGMKSKLMGMGKSFLSKKMGGQSSAGGSKLMGAALGGGGGFKKQMKAKAKAKAVNFAKKKFGSFFGGFQNKYDNKTLCDNLDKDPFARFYIIGFIGLLGYLLYKATQKNQNWHTEPSIFLVIAIITIFGFILYNKNHQLINLYKYGSYFLLQ